MPKWWCVATRGQGGHSSTAGSCGHQGWASQRSRCWGAPVGPIGFAHVVLNLLPAPSGSPRGKWQCGGAQGQGCTEALLAPTATMSGKPHAAVAGVTPWAPKVATMWCYLCWVLPVGCNGAKWQCVATGGLWAGPHCWPVWPLWLVDPMQQVVGSPNETQRGLPHGAASTTCHQ